MAILMLGWVCLIILLISLNNALILLPGLGLLGPPDQLVTTQQLFLKAALCLQQGQPLQKTYGLVIILPLSCDSIYNISSTIRKSGAGIGYGRKSDFTKDLTASPGSSKYQIKTIFDLNKTSRKGFTLYESR